MGRSSSINVCILLAAVSTPNYAGVSWWLRGPGLGVAPSGRASELVVTVQLRHSSGLRPLVLTLPLVSACWLPSSRLQPPDPGTVKTGVQWCSSSPHRHAAHIVDTGIVLTSPAQPSPAQPSPDRQMQAGAGQWWWCRGSPGGHRRSYKLNLVNCA